MLISILMNLNEEQIKAMIELIVTTLFPKNTYLLSSNYLFTSDIIKIEFFYLTTQYMIYYHE